MMLDKSGQRGTRWLALVLMLSAWLSAETVPGRAVAQDAAPAAAPAAAAAQPPAGNPAPNSAPNPDQPASQAKTQSYLMWFLESSGVIGLFIFFLSIYFVATVVRLFIEMRLQVEVPPLIVTQCHSLLEQKNLQAIYDVVVADDSFFSRVLAAGIAEMSMGLNDAREAMERVGEALTVEMEKRISILAVLGTLGPMIGLLGTLKGMIASFSVIAMSDVQLKASEVAGGISQALLLTFEGVILSVPAIYFFALFRNRVAVISVTALLEADQMLRRLARSARKRPVPPAATKT